MGRRFAGNTNTTNLKISTPVVTSVPLTLVAFYYPFNTTTLRVPLSVFSSNSQGWFIGINTSLQAVCRVSNASPTDCVSTSTITTNKWYHIGGVFRAANSRNVFLNGINENSSTLSKTPTSLTSTSVGCGDPTVGSVLAANGYVAHPAVWNVALTDGEMLQLAQGADPRTIRLQNLVAYWPLNTPGSTVEYDQNPFAPRRYDLTVTGATPAIDPPIWTPKRKRFWIPATTGGSTLELTPGAASITVTAQSGVVQRIANLTPPAASIVVTTQQGVLRQTANLTPGSCSIVVTQQAGTLQQVNRLNPSPAAIVVTQRSGTIQEVNRLSPTPAAILVTMQAGLLQTGATNIVPGAAQILVTMQAGVVVVPVNGIVFASSTIAAPSARATISTPTALTTIATAKAFATIASPKVTATISRPTVAASITRF